ncbi:alpha/beta hydrolase [cf. Phormidesmis sp. LEGE 11477]|uniref:alpha/beta hydrolase n=1 Tax=cf. Phormidesmis sp. LEGE 11477 TaxID=1828680 RepID=UPI0018809B18|nr:alpha/beta hydrolase [cf. Phormidesmis sp. LEGE 11477]MBE9060992.1 alpha/beta hydrolase [cf. Phormidesmis sp. LEGE 11477]
MRILQSAPYSLFSSLFNQRLFRQGAWGLGIGLLQAVLALSPQSARPGQAAEKIVFSLGSGIERSLSVDSLALYAEEGVITEELAAYLPYLQQVDPATLNQVREILTERVDTDVTAVAQFSYTEQGEYLLQQTGDVFRTGARLSGAQGLRGAAILAAADLEEGLTLLNVIQRFPTPVLRIDIRKGIAIAQLFDEAFQQSDTALELVEQISLARATEDLPGDTSGIRLTQLVTEPGPFRVRRQPIRVKASNRPVDIYTPILSTDLFDRSMQMSDFVWPAVVISHGLGNDRNTYAYLAEFLAEHGFAVINIEHGGSSDEQISALISGLRNEVVDTDEFVSRPQMISEVLDELERRDDFLEKGSGRIDFNNIGVIGQSFGGYTALAIAGAPLNLRQLRADCPLTSLSFNVSLLLQCQAVELSEENSLNENLNFRDPRIRAAIAINPITSKLFGQESLAEIDIPLMMISASNDTIAPALPEQIRPFTWLTKAPHYLLVMQGATHFSTIGITGTETFELPPAVVGPHPEIAQDYTQAMSLAFLNTYLKDEEQYAAVLTSAFTTRFSEPEIPLSLISELTPEQLAEQLR